MSTRLQVIVSDEEMTALRQAARRAGLTVSEWARQALRRARDEQAGPDPAIVARGADCRPTNPAGSLHRSAAQIPDAESRLCALDAPSRATTRPATSTRCSPTSSVVAVFVDASGAGRRE